MNQSFRIRNLLHQPWSLLVLFCAITGVGCSDLTSPAPPPPPPGPTAPVAKAGPDQANVAPGKTITLNGSKSSDVNGDPLTFLWTFFSTPAGSAAVLANPTSVFPTFVVDRAGDYVIQLIVNDGTFDSAPDTVTVTTNNARPIANAGPDQGVDLGTLVTLNGSGSSDANGDALTFSWSFTAKPAGSTATLSNPTAVKPTFTLDKFGDYIVQLIVNDGTVNSAPDTVIVTTNNVKPVANAGPNQGSIAPGTVVTLDGSGSSDANGDPLTYSWSFTTKPAGSTATLSNPTAVKPTFTLDKFGDYIVQLIVNDGTDNSLPDTVIVTLNNVAPVAKAGPDQSVNLGSVVTLDGSDSSDANGDALTFSWSFTAKPAGSTATLSNPTAVKPTFTLDKSGDYVVRLIVNDGTVNSAPDSVTVATNNVAPVANAGPDQSVNLGSVVTLDGSGSSDANGDALTFSWSFTAKPAGSTATLSNPTAVKPTFTLDKSGDYVVRLIVNDGTVNSAPDSVTVATNNVAPVANAGPDQLNIVPGTVVTLNGSGSSDANGDALTYSWSFISTPLGSTAVLLDATTVSPTFTVDKAGDYVVQLIVNDGTVSSAPDSVTVTTNNVAPVANAGPDQGSIIPGNVVTLDGSGSSDANGDALTYSWSFISTPLGSTAVLLDATTVSPTFILDMLGDYEVQLTVNDGTVDSAPDTVTVTTN